MSVPEQEGNCGHQRSPTRELRPGARPPSERDLASTCRPGVPVLGVWHASFDQGGEPYELTRFVMRGDMTGLLYDVPVE